MFNGIMAVNVRERNKNSTEISCISVNPKKVINGMLHYTPNTSLQAQQTFILNCTYLITMNEAQLTEITKSSFPPLTPSSPLFAPRRTTRKKKTSNTFSNEEPVQATTTTTSPELTATLTASHKGNSSPQISSLSTTTIVNAPTTTTTETKPLKKDTKKKKPSVTAQKSKEYHQKAKECKYRPYKIITGDFLTTLNNKDYYHNIFLSLPPEIETTSTKQEEIKIGARVKAYGQNNWLTVWGITIPRVGCRATLVVQDENHDNGEPVEISILDIIDIQQSNNWNSAAADSWMVMQKESWAKKHEQQELQKGKKYKIEKHSPSRETSPSPTSKRQKHSPKEIDISLTLLQNQLISLQEEVSKIREDLATVKIRLDMMKTEDKTDAVVRVVEAMSGHKHH